MRDMKKLLTVLIMLLMSGVNLLAEDHQQHIDLGWAKFLQLWISTKTAPCRQAWKSFWIYPILCFAPT